MRTGPGGHAARDGLHHGLSVSLFCLRSLILQLCAAFFVLLLPLRRQIADALVARLRPGGLLVLGNREELPGGMDRVVSTVHRSIYRRI